MGPSGVERNAKPVLSSAGRVRRWVGCGKIGLFLLCENLGSRKDRISGDDLGDHRRDLVASLGGGLDRIGVVRGLVADQAQIDEREPAREGLAGYDIVEER